MRKSIKKIIFILNLNPINLTSTKPWSWIQKKDTDDESLCS